MRGRLDACGATPVGLSRPGRSKCPARSLAEIGCRKSYFDATSKFCAEELGVYS